MLKYIIIWNSPIHGSEVSFMGSIFDSKEEADITIQKNCKYPDEFEICSVQINNYKESLK